MASFDKKDSKHCHRKQNVATCDVSESLVIFHLFTFLFPVLHPDLWNKGNVWASMCQGTVVGVERERDSRIVLTHVLIYHPQTQTETASYCGSGRRQGMTL